MAGERPNGTDPYRTARKWLGSLILAATVVMALASLLPGFHADAAILVPLLLTGCGLLAVDIPNLRGGK